MQLFLTLKSSIGVDILSLSVAKINVFIALLVWVREEREMFLDFFHIMGLTNNETIDIGCKTMHEN